MGNKFFITYRNNTPDLYDTIERYGVVTRNYTHIRCFSVAFYPEEVEEAIQVLQAHPDVERISENTKPEIKPRSLPTDFSAGVYLNADIYRSIRVDEAWEIQKGHPDVIGAIGDSGVDPTHPEIKDSLILPGMLAIHGFTPGITITETSVGINIYDFLRFKGYSATTLSNYNSAELIEERWLHGDEPTDQQHIQIYQDEACTIPLSQPYIFAQGSTVWARQAFTLAVQFQYGKSYFYAIGQRKMGDTYGHGTTVTGIAIGKHDTGEGAQGIAPGCKIVPMQIIADNGESMCDWDDIIDSFLFARTSGAAAINCSWGSSFEPPPEVRSAIEDTVTAGTIVVAAAGNYSYDNDYSLDETTFPNNVQGVINVGGTGFYKDFTAKTTFAVRCDRNLISAPCIDFNTPLPTNTSYFGGNVTNSGSAYVTGWRSAGTEGADGTSFSCPVVFGTVLLMLSEAKDRGRVLTSAEVAQIIADSAYPHIKSGYGTVFDTSTLNAYGYPVDGMGHGLLDVMRALRAVQLGIDARSTVITPDTKVGLAATFDLDVKTWGSGIASIDVYRNDVLYTTLTPGGSAYHATASVIPDAAGQMKVHFKATDLNGSVSTSRAQYVTVDAAVQPKLTLMKYPLKTHTQGHKTHSTFGQATYPVVVYGDNVVSVVLNSTKGQSLTFTTLSLSVDGVSKGSINVSGYAPSSTQRDFTFSGLAGLPEGFHNLSMTLSSGSYSHTVACKMVYSLNTTAPKVFADKFRYQNGILTAAFYFAGDISTSNGTNGAYYQKKAVWGTSFSVDGHYFHGIGFTNWNLDGYQELQAKVPRPSTVSLEVMFNTQDYDPEYGSSIYQDWTSVTATALPDPSNSPSIDTLVPATFADRGDGELPFGSLVTLQAYYPHTDTTIYYKWDDEQEYSTYAAPITARSRTLQWYGQDAAGNTEVLQSAVYEVAPPPPGSITAAAVSLVPSVAAPSLAGVQVGSIAASSVTLTPTVAVGTLSGTAATVGSISAPSVSLRPSVTPASLSGVQVGSMSVPAVTLRPSVAVGTLTGVEAVSVGSIAAASTTMQIQVNPPTLRGVTAGTAIRAPDGTVWDLRDIYGAPLDIRAVA